MCVLLGGGSVYRSVLIWIISIYLYWAFTAHIVSKQLHRKSVYTQEQKNTSPSTDVGKGRPSIGSRLEGETPPPQGGPGEERETELTEEECGRAEVRAV